MSVQEERKREVGRRAAELVRDGMVVGLGTGSTANHFIDRLGERVRESLQIRAVPTSQRTADRAEALGIELVTLEKCPRLDLAIDGADQIDPDGNLIKGLGGALLREKRVARAAREFVVIADASKEVSHLGIGCPIPVEVEAIRQEEVSRSLRALGGDPRPRMRDGRLYRTDNGNPILDTHFDGVGDPFVLEEHLNSLPGVLENGLFPGMAHRILIADRSGVREWIPPTRPETDRQDP
jgi:ribose 5-phosphate isomerase A